MNGESSAAGATGTTGSGVTRVTRVRLPDGTPVWARISGAEELAVPSGGLSYTDTGFAERVEASVESLHSLITGVARSLARPLRTVKPDEVSVEFGIELTAKAGKVVGLLADGEAKAGITITLTWHDGGPPDPDAPGGAAASATVVAPPVRAEPPASAPPPPAAPPPVSTQLSASAPPPSAAAQPPAAASAQPSASVPPPDASPAQLSARGAAPTRPVATAPAPRTPGTHEASGAPTAPHPGAPPGGRMHGGFGLPGAGGAG